MSDMNELWIIGRFTKDPELRHTQSGTSVASFSIANTRTYMVDGNKKEQTSFFNCVAWGKRGETLSQYCKKGNRVAITGYLQQRTWDNKEGVKQYTIEIIVEKFQFLTPKTQQGSGAPVVDTSDLGEPTISLPDIDNPFSDDDVPF